jgi:hypothetical protein
MISRQAPAFRLIRLGAALWLALGFAVWNMVFDREIKAAEGRYVRLQAEHERGRGPAVTIPGVMDPAKRHGAAVATGWATAFVVVGLGTLAAVGRVRRGKP